MFGSSRQQRLREVEQAVDLAVKLSDEFDDVDNPENVEKGTEMAIQLLEATERKSAVEQLVMKLIENPELAEEIFDRGVEIVMDNFFDEEPSDTDNDGSGFEIPDTDDTDGPLSDKDGFGFPDTESEGESAEE